MTDLPTPIEKLETRLHEPSRLVKLTKVFVAPHVRETEGGHLVHVAGYWRALRPGEKPGGKVTADDANFETGPRGKLRPKPGTHISNVGAKAGDGSDEHHPFVTTDVTAAAEALAQGKYVDLHQKNGESTLLKTLADYVKKADKAGEAAPNFDLCKAAVNDTNLFCAGNLGIERVKMPQLAGKPQPGTPAANMKTDEKGEVNLSAQFAQSLVDKGVKVTHEKVEASWLRASQRELDGAKVSRRAKQRRKHPKEYKRSVRIFITRDNYIIDGHHAWAGTVGAEYIEGKPLKVPVTRIDMSVTDALRAANEYTHRMGIASEGVFKKLARRLREAEALMLTRIYVPPYVKEQEGQIIHVDGYWRQQRRGESLQGKVTAPDDQFPDGPVSSRIEGRRTGTLTPSREAAMKVRMLNTQPGHDKFWEAERSGSKVTVRWGKNGTQGQSKTYELADESAAEQFVSKKSAEKLGHGYEYDDAQEAVPEPPVEAPAEPKLTPAEEMALKQVAKPKAAPKVKAAPKAAEVAPKAQGGPYLESHVGGSSKFWTAQRDGTTVSVKWGKIGTQGQGKDFSFDTEDDAQAYLDKKHAEKLAKGYLTPASAQAPSPPSSAEAATMKAYQDGTMKLTKKGDTASAECAVDGWSHTWSKGEATNEAIYQVVADHLSTHNTVDVTTDVGIADHLDPTLQGGDPTKPAAQRTKADWAAVAAQHGVLVTPDMTKVDIMDAMRDKLGVFDPSMDTTPAKAQDLKHQIQWSKKGHEFDDIQGWLTPEYVMEPKFDGVRFRVLLGKDANSMNSGKRSTQTLDYIDRSDNFPQFRDTVVPELAGTVLDGELLPATNEMDIGGGEHTEGSLNTVMALMNINPKDAVARQKKNGNAVYMVFDVTAVKGEDVTGLPQEKRREMLEQIMGVLTTRDPSFQIAPEFDATEDNIRTNLDQGLEGVMIKKRDSKYYPGKRMETWQKVKRYSTGDFYIIGSIPGKSGNKGKVGSLKVAYRGANGEDVYVADVAGFDEATRAKLTDPETGDVKKEYLGSVIEVMGQTVTKNNRIRHPQFVRFRDDKAAEDTDKSQLDLFKYSNV